MENARGLACLLNMRSKKLAQRAMTRLAGSTDLSIMMGFKVLYVPHRMLKIALRA